MADIKKALIKCITNFKGIPKDKKNEVDEIVTELEEDNTVIIPPNKNVSQADEASYFLVNKFISTFSSGKLSEVNKKNINLFAKEIGLDEKVEKRHSGVGPKK